MNTLAQARETGQEVRALAPLVTAVTPHRGSKGADPVTAVPAVTASGDKQGAAILSEVAAFLGRFIVYPSEDARIAHALWIAHSHLMDAWHTTPRLAFLSPEPASGKTRALEVTALMVPRPVDAFSVSSAYLFRKVSGAEGRPTILFDEVDTVFGPRAKEHEDIRGMLNAGHRKGATAGRCAIRGKTIETEDYPAYCAVALAGLGTLPDTLLSRSIVVRMRRRARSEAVDPYRERLYGEAGRDLGQRLAEWLAAANSAGELAAAVPDLPAAIQDRAADCWEPLVVVADAAGGEWPAMARRAAVNMVQDAEDTPASLGVWLLHDVFRLFTSHPYADKDALRTSDLVEGLKGLEEAPWGELNLNPNSLARMLGEHRVKSTTIRFGKDTFKGYQRADFTQAWASHPPPSSPNGVTAVTTVTGVTAVTDPPEDAEAAPGGESAPQPTSQESPIDYTPKRLEQYQWTYAHFDQLRGEESRDDYLTDVVTADLWAFICQDRLDGHPHDAMRDALDAAAREQSLPASFVDWLRVAPIPGKHRRDWSYA